MAASEFGRQCSGHPEKGAVFKCTSKTTWLQLSLDYVKLGSSLSYALGLDDANACMFPLSNTHPPTTGTYSNLTVISVAYWFFLDCWPVGLYE